MISYFKKIATELDTANGIHSKTASFGDSKQTEVSGTTFLLDRKKTIVTMMVQEKQKGHRHKLPTIPKRRRLTKHAGLDRVFLKRRILATTLHYNVKGDVKS